MKITQTINKVEDETKIFINNCFTLNPMCDKSHHPPIELPIVKNKQNKMNSTYNIPPNVILPSIFIYHKDIRINQNNQILFYKYLYKSSGRSHFVIPKSLIIDFTNFFLSSSEPSISFSNSKILLYFFSG